MTETEATRREPPTMRTQDPGYRGPGAPQTRENVPSTVALDPDLHQVMVDQWGHKGEFVRGQIVHRNDIDPAHYDLEHAVRMGALRQLTEAEARAESWPTTTPQEFGEDERRSVRYRAGVPEDLEETVTTEQGPAEPAEFAKPTLPGPENNQPAARPIRVASAEEAMAAGGRRGRAVPTSAGPAYERRAERETREKQQRQSPSGDPRSEG